MKTAKEFPGAHVRLLDHVFRIVVIPGQPACQIVRGREMRQDGVLKPGVLAFCVHRVAFITYSIQEKDFAKHEA